MSLIYSLCRTVKEQRQFLFAFLYLCTFSTSEQWEYMYIHVAYLMPPALFLSKAFSAELFRQFFTTRFTMCHNSCLEKLQDAGSFIANYKLGK